MVERALVAEGGGVLLKPGHAKLHNLKGVGILAKYLILNFNVVAADEGKKL